MVWVAEGCEKILDEDDPHLDLRSFFPCPRPAYGTTQRGSLVPVPDVLQYEDQLDEINRSPDAFTRCPTRLRSRGSILPAAPSSPTRSKPRSQIKTPGRLLVPISNWAAFGGSKEVIIWLPIDMIATTITALVALRKQIIEDIYQIMGLSDIMRGATDPHETLGAQQLKTQYGSTRIRDKQQELVRLARDLVEHRRDHHRELRRGDDHRDEPDPTADQAHAGEAGKRAGAADPAAGAAARAGAADAAAIPTNADIIAAAERGWREWRRSHSDTTASAGAAATGAGDATAAEPGPGPDAAAAPAARAADDRPGAEIPERHRAKSFVLDIETDSTILADEHAEKQPRTEFVGVLAPLMPQLCHMITAEPRRPNFAAIYSSSLPRHSERAGRSTARSTT